MNGVSGICWLTNLVDICDWSCYFWLEAALIRSKLHTTEQPSHNIYIDIIVNITVGNTEINEITFFIYNVSFFLHFPPLAFYCLPEQIKLLPKVQPFFLVFCVFSFFVGPDFLAPFSHTTFCHTERYIERIFFFFFAIWMKCVKWKPKPELLGVGVDFTPKSTANQ